MRPHSSYWWNIMHQKCGNSVINDQSYAIEIIFKSWEPFWIYQLISTANPDQFTPKGPDWLYWLSGRSKYDQLKDFDGSKLWFFFFLKCQFSLYWSLLKILDVWQKKPTYIESLGHICIYKQLFWTVCNSFFYYL